MMPMSPRHSRRRVLALLFSLNVVPVCACNDESASSPPSEKTQPGNELRWSGSETECPSNDNCANGAECFDVSEIDPTKPGAFCITGNPCALVTCAKGHCAIDDIGPPEVVCVEDL